MQVNENYGLLQIKQGAPQGVFYDNAPTQALVLLGSLLTFCSIEIFGSTSPVFRVPIENLENLEFSEDFANLQN